jgi:hypothetical protein
MKKILRRSAVALAVLLAAMQFYRPPKNLASGPGGHDVTQVLPVSAEVSGILHTACYDCHSDSTRYPWYAEIQPVGWYLNGHIEDGKEGLNFDRYADYPPRRQYRRLAGIRNHIEKSEMPLPSYLILHADARLTEEQKALLYQWVSAGQDTLRARYPLDSLERAPARRAGEGDSRRQGEGQRSVP